MPEGIYAAAAGMAAQQAQLDAVSNDIANVNTAGYKSERLGFHDLVYQAEMGAPVGAGAAPIDLGRTTAAGSLNDTGNPLDVAIVGAGYFQVKRADGTTALTRNGQFQVDGNGSIVTQTGERLVPPITLPKGTDPSTVTIASDGQVTAGGAAIGKISIVDVTNPGGLLSVGNNLFAATASSGAPAAARGSTLQQGAIESSNVDLASAMTDMIEAQRGFQFASRMIATQSQLLDDANQLVR